METPRASMLRRVTCISQFPYRTIVLQQVPQSLCSYIVRGCFCEVLLFVSVLYLDALLVPWLF